MSYSEPLVRQAQVFLVFFGVGCLLRLVLFVFDFFRLLFSNRRAAAYVCDTLFCAAALLIIFFFFLAFTNGRVRLVLLFASGAGFAITQRGIGKLLYASAYTLSKGVRRAAGIVILPLRAFAHDVSFGVRRGAKTVWKIRTRLREKRPARKKKRDCRPKHEKKRKKHEKLLQNNKFPLAKS